MDTALVVITLLSLALTGALLVYAARLQREQREREEARVQVLASDIRAAADEVDRPVLREISSPPRMFVSHDTPSRPMASGPDPLAGVVPDLVTATDAPPLDQGAVFGAALDTPPSRARIVIPLAGALVVGVVLGGVYLLNARPAPAAHAAAAAAVTAAPPIELMTLQQSLRGTALTVSGVVRNPDGAASRKGVTAVVFVFDPSGAFVSSARAPIDYQVLAPGDESPFRVTVPNAKGVARYRVSFRTEADVLPHVDRRGAQQPR